MATFLAQQQIFGTPLYYIFDKILHHTVFQWVIINYFLCSSSRVSNRFHLAQCTFSYELEQKETVYISQPEHHQIIRIKKLTGVSDSELEINSEPFIGNGERCLPGDSDGCGDGGKAIKARLTYPKGIFLTSFFSIMCLLQLFNF